jgi:hypothetical protein
MLDGVLEHRAGPTKTVAGIEQAIDLRSVPHPLLDLVEIAQVGDQRIGGLLVEANVVGLRIGHGPIIVPSEPLRVGCHRLRLVCPMALQARRSDVVRDASRLARNSGPSLTDYSGCQNLSSVGASNERK